MLLKLNLSSILFLIGLFLIPFLNAHAHHGKPTDLYICKVVASAVFNGNYEDGDGTPEGGQFFGEFYDEYRHGDQIKLKLHGSISEGGYIEFDDKSIGKKQLPIIQDSYYSKFPYSPYNKGGDHQVLLVTGVLISYPLTIFASFVRGTLRLTFWKNSPTNNVASTNVIFADCKFIGKE